MKFLPFLLVVTFGLTAFAEDPANSTKDRAVSDLPASQATRSPDAPWSIVGTWDFTNRVWSGSLVLKADGSVTGDTEWLNGRWMLGVQGEQIILMLYWDKNPTELATMINADEFHGSVVRSDLRMRRRPTAPAPVKIAPPKIAPPGGFGGVETQTWNQGELPVKLIRQEEGFCALTKVTGSFQGIGESVRVYVGDDGYWYLGGTSFQAGVAAECIVVRYPK